jgi:hypothetical protein
MTDTPNKPSGFTSVMAQRAPTDPDDLDYFPTPPWAARAGGELIKMLDPAARTCWEPACGEGHMAHGLADYFENVACSDIHNYGRGWVQDFLEEPARFADGAGYDWIVTNPPFIDGEKFVRVAWDRAGRGVAMLLRLVFLEGGARWKLFYGDEPGSPHLTVCAPFAERVPMVKGRWDPAASSATAYAWFFWCKPCCWDGPRALWAPQLQGIAPGAKKRLTRPSDQQFAPDLDIGSLFGGKI